MKSTFNIHNKGVIILVKLSHVISLIGIILVCVGCSGEPLTEGEPDAQDDLSDMPFDMAEKDMAIAEDMAKDAPLDAAPDLVDMDEPDLLAPGQPCDMDDQCVRGAVCDRDTCSVIVGCAEFFDDPPPTLADNGCWVTGFSSSQSVAFECDSDDACDDGKPCVMNACQDGARCDDSSSCPSMQVCYAGVCVEER